MSQVYNPEANQMERIEKLALEARECRRRVDRSRNAEDRRILNRLLQEMEQQIRFLQERLPH